MKKTWKRLSALVLALCMVLSLLSASVWADGDPQLTITVGDATAKAGEYAEITVSVANNGEPGIAGMALEFVLPAGVSMVASDGLNSPNPFVDLKDSIFKDGILLPNDDGRTVSLLSGDAVKGNGNLLKINVAVDASATANDYSIGVRCKDNQPSNICDIDGNTVETDFVAGTLTVESGKHTHKLQHVEAKPATATEDGNTKYWYCKGCYKYFSDANGITEIADPSGIVIVHAECSEGEHDWDEHRIEPRLRIEGAVEKKCKKCGKEVTEVIPALKLGDVDGDGDVTVADFGLLNRALLKYIELTAEQKARADLDEDGDVTVADFGKLNRILLKYETM